MQFNPSNRFFIFLFIHIQFKKGKKNQINSIYDRQIATRAISSIALQALLAMEDIGFRNVLKSISFIFYGLDLAVALSLVVERILEKPSWPI